MRGQTRQTGPKVFGDVDEGRRSIVATPVYYSYRPGTLMLGWVGTSTIQDDWGMVNVEQRQLEKDAREECKTSVRSALLKLEDVF